MRGEALRLGGVKLPYPSKPSLTDEEQELITRLRDEKVGWRRIAHEISKRRGAFDVADPRSREFRTLSHSYCRHNHVRKPSPTVNLHESASENREAESLPFDVDARETERQPDIFTQGGTDLLVCEGCGAVSDRSLEGTPCPACGNPKLGWPWGVKDHDTEATESPDQTVAFQEGKAATGATNADVDGRSKA